MIVVDTALLSVLGLDFGMTFGAESLWVCPKSPRAKAQYKDFPAVCLPGNEIIWGCLPSMRSHNLGLVCLLFFFFLSGFFFYYQMMSCAVIRNCDFQGRGVSDSLCFCED